MGKLIRPWLFVILSSSLLLGSRSIRVLRQYDVPDPRSYGAKTYTSAKGQQPGGYFSIADKAEAAAGSGSRGARYNAGKVVTSGDMYPGPKAGGVTNMAAEQMAISSSGNTATEANVNLGLEVAAATAYGARAVSGAGTMHTAADDAAATSNQMLFTPMTVTNRGSVSFTGIAPKSAAVSASGNGPVAMAWGNEVGSMARASQSRGFSLVDPSVRRGAKRLED